MQIDQRKYSGDYVGEVHYKMIKDALSLLPEGINNFEISPSVLILIQSANMHKPGFFERNQGSNPIGTIQHYLVYMNTTDPSAKIHFDGANVNSIEFINISFI